ncbi:MAG: DUF4080 domain-containing protein [Burkholderiales bacterium]|nr:DUF4080 domain-containing protein [Burkholderiales bacterium]
MPALVLSTLNARYAHASLGLRYLFANLDEDIRAETRIVEFVIGSKTEVLVEQLLALDAKAIGFGVYIWNVEETTKLIAMLKAVAPQIKVVIGGPEVSYETAEQRIYQLADYVVTGQGDVTFNKLARALLHGPKPLMKVHVGEAFELDDIALPYDYYTDEDIARRHLYVEASRGCPFKCEFCLSALDKTAEPFNTERFLAEMAKLYDRGARTFKFVDRTFNLNVKTSLAILDFFLERINAHPDDPCFAHFELVPDHLPEKLKDTIAKFPAGTLQFEIGIQTWNPEVQGHISRKQNNDKAKENIRWLHENSHAHMHVDLIAGLPSETLESFGLGFDTLARLGPHEIQVGVLKRLRGTPIIRHTDAFAMRYNPEPPYNILSNTELSFADVQRISRFARFWDLIGNSGRFTQALPLVLAEVPTSAFARFLALADWLYAETGATHQIALERLFDLVYRWLISDGAIAVETAQAAILADYQRSGSKGRLSFMTRGFTASDDTANAGARKATPARQRRHLSDATLSSD